MKSLVDMFKFLKKKKKKEKQFSTWKSFPSPKKLLNSSYSISVVHFGTIYVFNYNSTLVHEYNSIQGWKHHETQFSFTSNYHSFVVYKRNIYFYGGTNSKTLLLFNLDRKTWKRILLPNAPRARYLHSANIINKKMYVFGGVVFDRNRHKTSNQLWILDLKLLKWKNGDKLESCERCNHSTCVYNNNLYIFGGKIFLGNSKNDIIVYNPKTEKWNKLLTFPMDLGLNSITLIRNSIFFTSLDSFDLYEYCIKGNVFYNIPSKLDLQNYQLLREIEN
eukprot:gene8155-12616_t